MTARKFADYDNVAYIWEKIKNKFVAKESGKGLSEANYTQTEKTKLAGIAAGAEVNVNADWDANTGDAAILNKPTKLSDFTDDVTVQSNWTESDNTKKDYIKNKPSNLVQDANYVHTDNNYTNTEKSKLAGIEAGAEANVNPDWNASSGDAQILNKPTIPTVDQQMSDSSTNAISNSVVKGYIDDAISGVTGIDFQIVQTLPSTGTKGVIYLVSHSGTAPDIYDEYIWITVSGTGQFEKIGTTQIDLSSYMQFSDMIPLTTAEIDAICV